MRVLITGAAGFIGRHLLQAVLDGDLLHDPAGGTGPISEIVLADLHPAQPPPRTDAVRITVATGDVGSTAFLGRLFGENGFASVFHLAATLTGEAETNISHGLSVNVAGMLALLECCRAQDQPPRLVFASSIAAFGGTLPPVVEDDTPRYPQTSYGAHKLIAEVLLADHARHGLVDGRSLRLPIVLIRPGAPNPAVSDRVAAILREPLAGRDLACPLRPDTEIPVASVQRVARALCRVHGLPGDALGPQRAMNMPALTVRVEEMVAALWRFAGRLRLGRVSWAPDPVLQAVVDGWPRRFHSAVAAGYGITADPDIGAIIDGFLDGVTAAPAGRADHA